VRARPALRFRRDGTFTIVQLTDVHWSNGDGADGKTRALIEAVLLAERPDLVVLSGDIISGKEATDPRAAYGQVAALLESQDAPWAAVFGNHDDEGSASRKDLLRVQRRSPQCLTAAGPKGVTGVGNYVLRVRESRSERMAAALYCLDSGSYDNLGIGHYAWIARDQIAWFLGASSRLKREYARGAPAARDAETLPALAFFHIPLPEWDEVWRTRVCRGHRHEPVASPAVNSGFFAAMVEAGDVMGAFCGHDHVNDFEGELHGIRLGYGRATGFGEYGREGFSRGARVIRLREGKRSFDTWFRLEGGAKRKAGPVHEPDASKG
jgi:hypothetical protein